MAQKPTTRTRAHDTPTIPQRKRPFQKTPKNIREKQMLDPLDEQRLSKNRTKKERNWKVTVAFTVFGHWQWHKYYAKEVDALKAYNKYKRAGKDVSLEKLK